MNYKIIFGGFPCTHFSIAQKNDRIKDIGFTSAEFIKFRSQNKDWWNYIADFEKQIGEKQGILDYRFADGIQLFFNCLVALDRFGYDFYLFENVASMQKNIKTTITEIMSKLYGGNMIEINSALVSAQNRRRIYWTNFSVKAPKNRGIFLKDILECGNEYLDKSQCLTSNYFGAEISNSLEKSQRTMVAEPLAVSERGRYSDTGNRHKMTDGKIEQYYEIRGDGTKTNAMTTVSKDTLVALRVGDMPSANGNINKSQAQRIYAIKGKSVNLTANAGGLGAKTGLYAIPCYDKPHGYNSGGICDKEKANTLTTAKYQDNHFVVDKYAVITEFDGEIPIKARSRADGKEYPVYSVLNGQITVKNKTYPIRLADGFYIVRKLTVKECCRLQTLPDDYFRNKANEKIISDTQAYRCLGNGWTLEVIKHILSCGVSALKPDDELDVISLYDGISTGYLALTSLGFTKINYTAYEIDKYARAVSEYHFPDIKRLGNAFEVRE